MSLPDLQKVLQHQVNQSGTILVSQSTLVSANLTPSLGFDTTVQSYLVLTGPLLVTVAGSIPAPNGNTLTVFGTASLLGLSAIRVAVAFTLETGTNTVDVLLVATLPSGWSFSSSFPQLNGFPFADLVISQPIWLLTTAAQASYLWNGQTLVLQKGLNFASLLGLGSLFSILNALISNLTSKGPVVFSGTVDPTGITNLTTGTPAVTLSGDINTPITAHTPFDLSLPQILLTSSLDENNYLTYWLYFSSTLSLPSSTPGGQSRPFSTIQAALIGNTPSLSLSLLSTTSPITVPEIIALIGNVDFTQSIPPLLQNAFSSVGLKGLAARLNVKTLEVNTLSVDISTTQSVAIGQFTIESLVLNCLIFSPFNAAIRSTLVTFTAKILFFPNTFKGDFVFEISYDVNSKEMTLDANFLGVVYLKDLVSDLSGNKVILPKSFPDIAFSDFGISLTESKGSTGQSYDWLLYGGDERLTVPLGLAAGTLTATFQVIVQSTAGQRTYQLKGGLEVGNNSFEIMLDLGKGSNELNASWHSVGLPLSFEDIAEAFGFTPPDIPPDLDLALESASFTYDFDAKILVLSADSANYGKAVFVSRPVNKVQEYFFLLEVGENFSLASLPLVGKELADVGTIQVGPLEVIIASKLADQHTVSLINSYIPSGYPQLPESGTTGLFILAAQFDFDGQSKPLALSLGGSNTQVSSAIAVDSYTAGLLTAESDLDKVNVLAAASTSGANRPAGGVSIQKKVGPIFIDSLGITYSGGMLTGSLIASITLGPMNVSLNGLSFGSAISKSQFNPVFNLQGLGFGYTAPGLTIEGAILRVPDSQLASNVEFQFDGALIVQAEKWGLTALASYAQLKSGLPSLFLFIDVNATLGGPPFFIVEGLMAGFGYNRSLALPSFDEVQNFPLLAIGGPQTGSAQDQAMATLQILEGQSPGVDGTTKQWITSKEGDYWVAAGVKFSSFEIVQGELLLVAEFGHDLQFAVLGLAWLSLPQGASAIDTFVYVVLQVEAVFKPTEGSLSVAGGLTSGSFVLTKDCHLTGGFAFDLWFGNNPHSGQFVMTVGGYHPAFTVPSYYPNVARLGFNWQVSDVISIKGDSYFAITPSCGMGGGGLEALYQSGAIKAWFTAQANMLVTWNPFSFVAVMSIDIGASVRLNLLVCHKTISVSIGASLNLWGSPLGGVVTVHIVIVTVTIRFGSDSALDKNRQPLVWGSFKRLLPEVKEVIKLAVNTGLTKTLERDETTGGIIFSNQPRPAHGSIHKLWVVRAGTFSFSSQSAIPASALTYGTTHNYSKNITGSGNIAIRPMNLTGISSSHNLQISKNTAGSTPIDVTDWTMTSNTGNLPGALWGTPLTDSAGAFVQAPSVPSNDTIFNQLTGYFVKAPDAVLGATFGVVSMADLAEEIIWPGIAQNPLSLHPTRSSEYAPSASSTTIADIAGIAMTASANRNALYAVLSNSQIYTGMNNTMQGMAADAPNMFAEAPMEQS